jgi:cell fate (sporulation/competence/biofilm development) regulator YlbF (YheA/YmcA/DUF963 family)
MAEILDMARDLGQAMGRTEEYKALKRALEGMDDDRELAELKSELERMESEIETQLRAGQQPDDETRTAYEGVVTRLQANSNYQRVIAAQTNFDKVVMRVNETIAKGIQEGGESQIILAT